MGRMEKEMGRKGREVVEMRGWVELKGEWNEDEVKRVAEEVGNKGRGVDVVVLGGPGNVIVKMGNGTKEGSVQSSPDTRTGRTFAPNAHVEREQSLRHPLCRGGGGGLCVPRHPDIETFYTKCANLSTVYTFTQSRHLLLPTNSASSSCLLTKCNGLSIP